MTTRFESARGKSANAGFEVVLLSALPDDGGVFLPIGLPRLSPKEIRGLRRLGYSALAGGLLPCLIGAHIAADARQELFDEANGSFRHRAVAPFEQSGDLIWLMALLNWPASAGERPVTAVDFINSARVATQPVYSFHAALMLGAPDREVMLKRIVTQNSDNMYEKAF